MKPILFLILLTTALHAQHPGKDDDDYDPYNLLPEPGSTRDTAGEQFAPALDLKLASDYLDLRRHNVQRTCYACHSAGAFTAARSWLDPLAPAMMEQRAYMERHAKDFTAKSPLDKVRGSVQRAGQVLVALGMAQHDARSTGTLQPSTRKALDHVWSFLKDDGGLHWVPFKEAPSAIDHLWGNMLLAEAAGTAPGNYKDTEPAKSALVKLRLWFALPQNAPKDLHECGMRLLAHSFIGGIVGEEQRSEHIAAFFAKQQPTHGWSTATLSVHPDWKRPDGQKLDATRSDSYATAFAVLVLTKAGIPATEPRLAAAIDWLKNSQRQSGGWFTRSPRKKDILASYQATSTAIQALAAVGIIPAPKKVSQADFDTALAAADKRIPAGITAPSSTGAQQARSANMSSAAPAPDPSSPAPASALQQRALAAHGGTEKLLRHFQFTETITPENGIPTTQQHRIAAPIGKLTEAEKRHRTLTAAWTLTLLTDPSSRIAPLPSITLEGKEHPGLKITGSATPAVHLHFHPETHRVSRIGYAGSLHFPEAYTTTEGAKHPTQLRVTNVKGDPRSIIGISAVKRLSP